MDWALPPLDPQPEKPGARGFRFPGPEKSDPELREAPQEFFGEGSEERSPSVVRVSLIFPKSRAVGTKNSFFPMPGLPVAIGGDPEFASQL